MLPEVQSYDGLGGDINDYAPVVDPTTDLPAEASNETRADVAAMTRTIGRAFVSFDNGGEVSLHDAVWGNSDAVKPVVAVLSTGRYQITWPSSVTDARGVSRPVNLRIGVPSLVDVGYVPAVEKTAPSVFLFQVYGIAAGTFDDPPSAISLVVM